MMVRLREYADGIVLADGWRRRIIALVAGAVGALALVPISITPALWLSLPVAVWLIDGATSGVGRFSPRAMLSAAKDGWWFGFGYFLASLWWIGAAFLVETDEFAWAMPLGVLGLPAGMALFFALAFAIARLLWSAGAWRIFALAFGFGLAELIRHVIFTGFPWNTYGQAFSAWLPLAQSASFIGAEGLTLVAVLVFAGPATVVDERRSPWKPTMLGIALLAVLLGYGTLRLHLSGGLRAGLQDIETVPGVRIRLVQPNISQRDKIHETDGYAVLTKLFQLSDRALGPQANGMADVTHIVWPESPFPFLLPNEPKAMEAVAKALPPKTVLITGAVRREDGATRADDKYYNSLLAFANGGRLVATYDKTHLVPFGEYLPLEQWLKRVGLRRFVHAPGAFSLGSSRAFLEIPGLPPVLPLICYEAIFPHEIDISGERPGLIINITNDAWFGATIGPHQHFHQARLRAIEFGIPVIRDANTGISAVIDPFGRAFGSQPLNTEAISDVTLPKALTLTPYSVQRGISAQLLLAIVFFCALVMPIVAQWRRKRSVGQSNARSGEK